MIDASSVNRDDFVFSPCIKKGARYSNRKAFFFQINQIFVPSRDLVVHCDEKILMDCSDKSKEHIAVAKSGTPDYERGKLFGVKKTAI